MIYLSLTILILGVLQIFWGKPLVNINTGTQWNSVYNEKQRADEERDKARNLEHRLHLMEHELEVAKMRTPLEKTL